jgi:hypothetical protein
MFAAFEKCSRQTFAPDEKCLWPLKNVRAKPLRLMRMFAAFEKCSRQTFAPDENVCGL